MLEGLWLGPSLGVIPSPERPSVVLYGVSGGDASGGEVSGCQARAHATREISMQPSLHRGVAVAPEPMAALASMTVQPRRVVSSCMASIGIARICWSWGDTRAGRATRRGDTKPPCKMGKATLELPGGRVLQIWDDTPLVLCQHGSPRTPCRDQAADTPGMGGTVPGWWCQHG